MDIQHIRYFLEIARQESFSRAAARLYVTQPVLTRCVKNLEQELGVPLIVRSTKSFALTDAGEVLAQHGEQLLLQYEDLHQRIRDVKEIQTGELHIASPGVLLDMYFPRLMMEYHQLHPGIRITLSEQGSRPVLQEVLSGSADIGIVMLPMQDAHNLHIFPILRDCVHAVVPAGHPFSKEETLDIRKLQGENIITHHHSTTLYNTFMDLCRTHGFTPNIAYQSMMPNFILDTIAFGGCVGVLPGPMLQLCHGQNLTSVPLSPHFPWEIAMITRKDRYLSGAAASFLAFSQSFLSGASEEQV